MELTTLVVICIEYKSDVNQISLHSQPRQLLIVICAGEILDPVFRFKIAAKKILTKDSHQL